MAYQSHNTTKLRQYMDGTTPQTVCEKNLELDRDKNNNISRNSLEVSFIDHQIASPTIPRYGHLSGNNPLISLPKITKIDQSVS